MTPALRQNLTLAVLVLTGINMRPLLTSIGPLLPDIRAASGMSYTLAALLTALPVITMGGAGAGRWLGRSLYRSKAQYCAEPADYRGRRPAAGNRPE
ncbi:putative cyanate transport protein CynX [Klebsiella pneumoniae subsp. rhinoscleromatis ATCC 13884]|uniref:Cyanate transport protein CynX n=1 Tax=Klebsiella pneumoniae TaxID=573 RepID=A0A377XCR0_KLEPN|nr:putative cyanate transport protein CynX [Klebsiella pneumoniae subsp. rhinoscleromatis ATCC 13884]STT65938.1 cyanate transport protein CynX [Klebsiella pneumoniae]STV42821.1 cyanate transport protein CynX [Klebsiella pneumoniae subsp. rhinoscleromatis]STT79116.1 cyanate transport protein CynX [Klebsiella pneumoniae]STU07835.1 cyanate transport protein CynX [Klebsiella pneumoniae]